MSRLIYAAVAAEFLLSGVAYGSTISGVFSGVVESVSSSYNDNITVVDEEISGEFRIDIESFSRTIDPTQSQYTSDGITGQNSYSFTIGNRTYSSSEHSQYRIDIVNDDPGFGDDFSLIFATENVSGEGEFESGQGLQNYGNSITIGISDPEGKFLSSPALDDFETSISSIVQSNSRFLALIGNGPVRNGFHVSTASEIIQGPIEEFSVGSSSPLVPSSEGYFGEERVLLGDVDDIGPNAFDPSKPIVVLTHGWSGGIAGGNEYTGDIGDSAIIEPMYDAIKSEYGDEINVVVYMWEEAFVDTGEALGDDFAQIDLIDIELAGFAIPEIGFLKVENELPAIVADVGMDLGLKIRELIQQSDVGDGQFLENIHFIGHSYGSAVNLHAVDVLNDLGYGVEHMTILDAPTDGRPVSGQLDVELFDSIVSEMVAKGTYVDNYYGTIPTVAGGFGAPIEGAQLSGGLVQGGYSAFVNHNGVATEYAQSIPGIEGESVFAGEGFLYSAALQEVGGHWDLRPRDLEATVLQQTNIIQVVPSSPVYSENAFLFMSDGLTNLDISTGSDGFTQFGVVVPPDIDFLAFDLIFPKPGDGDWLEVSFNDRVLYQMSGSTLGNLDLSVKIPFSKFAGLDGSLSFLLSSDGPMPASANLSNISWEAIVRTEGPTPVPLPAGGYLLVTALASFAVLRKRTLAE